MNTSLYGKPTKRWITKTYYVDLDTGERINKEKAEEQYRVINTKKHVYAKPTQMVQEITKECRKNDTRQLDIYDEYRKKREADRQRKNHWHTINKRNARR